MTGANCQTISRPIERAVRLCKIHVLFSQAKSRCGAVHNEWDELALRDAAS